MDKEAEVFLNEKSSRRKIDTTYFPRKWVNHLNLISAAQLRGIYGIYLESTCSDSRRGEESKSFDVERLTLTGNDFAHLHHLLCENLI